ncbi:flavin reductase family protein [Cereibacter azotoformans]|uniref:Flavin reductase (DIM6/NTAB) family NADH-FMN oxidoreductase RutF n=2 Tax=Cereibacter TaxID=1653176 RepID=A0A2T5KAT8_9RHOB|nr:flavin reductase family protein [Cereibacter azotoformans]AXQ93973.1 flavin reductase family protein [Cereibacter sphaeroides]MBO4168213.1 flavin reductase family protein [Cereibacter azotoformans]PTR19527.1 flavin reductase (DIM6/NTAB) family NADH-FMN oxidoreductase RutF [Cereibacter azotoformans]UIJ29492.1 flavin reductase family protein [Cereibacter azotoformans]ULB10207.1 flavin reductase family protein [Cereibacter azotoformans]
MMLDLGALPPATRYKLLTAIVLPRPVAWVTTQSPEGVVNAAPFSFFNLFGQNPALVVLGLEHRADGSMKDTTRNIRETGEFVVNIVTEDLVAPMVASAAAAGPEVSEPEALGLALAPSLTVGPPRLAAAPAAIECRRTVGLSFSAEREILVGEALGLAARDGLIDPERWYVDWQGDYPVARLFADRYARLVEIDRHPIPAAL